MYTNKVLDVAGGKDEEGNNVQIYKPNGSPAQKWRLVYIDSKEAKKELEGTTGMNKDFGL